MNLKEEIVEGGFDLQNRDDGAIASLLSKDRFKIVSTEIGKGKILETLGLEAGNIVLDAIDTLPEFRHVKRLVENGWLNVGSEMVRLAITNMVPALLNQTEATALLDLAKQPEISTAQDVAKALEEV